MLQHSNTCNTTTLVTTLLNTCYNTTKRVTTLHNTCNNTSTRVTTLQHVLQHYNTTKRVTSSLRTSISFSLSEECAALVNFLFASTSLSDSSFRNLRSSFSVSSCNRKWIVLVNFKKNVKPETHQQGAAKISVFCRYLNSVAPTTFFMLYAHGKLVKWHSPRGLPVALCRYSAA